MNAWEERGYWTVGCDTAGYLTNHGKQLLAERWKELDSMAYVDDTIRVRAKEVDEDYGPIQQGVMELHKRCEMLHLTVERLERKFRPVLRSVPDKPTERESSPHPVVSELTERITAISASLAALDMTINDMNTRCEL